MQYIMTSNFIGLANNFLPLTHLYSAQKKLEKLISWIIN